MTILKLLASDDRPLIATLVVARPAGVKMVRQREYCPQPFCE
jgi:hypothetical protein